MAVALLLVLLLSACGGIGGGGGSTNPSAPPSPRAANDTANVNEDETVNINVLSNDTSVTSSSIALGDAPENGTTTINGTNIDYAPDPDFFGADSFGYTVDSSTGTPLNATVSVTVNNVNDSPIAAADNIGLLEDTPTAIDLTVNDTDIDDDITAVSISTDPDNGTTTIEGTTVTYTPDLNYSGTDAFVYEAIDNSGASSNSVTVSITINPITTTILTVTSLEIPSADYTSANNTEYPTAVLTSPSQTLTIPPNTVSFSLTLRGPEVAISEASLFIAALQSPNDDISAFRQEVGFCDAGLCSSLIPRCPDVRATPGDWQFSLGTLSETLTHIDLTNKSLDVAIRTGPDPDPDAEFPATITVKPFLAGPGITELELETILTRFVDIASSNAINIALLPVTVLDDPRFAEISIDFLDPTTADLVNMGDAAAVNLFFLDSFAGPNGGAILGVAGGIPGTQGIASNFNGVLINALATHDGPTEFFVRNTAQFSFHEMGHHLGLYHTTEGDFSFNDVLDDTPNCELAVNDDNDNGLADINECPDSANPMFWKPDLLNAIEQTTTDQRQVLFHTPIARP